MMVDRPLTRKGQPHEGGVYCSRNVRQIGSGAMSASRLELREPSRYGLKVVRFANLFCRMSYLLREPIGINDSHVLSVFGAHSESYPRQLPFLTTYVCERQPVFVVIQPCYF
jgi:hypothetical protein